MAAPVGVKVEGLRELSSSLNRVEKGLAKEMANIHKRLAAPVAELARSKVNSRSGRLASSVRALATQRRAQIAAGRGNMIYAPINHYGGYPGSYAGNPFLDDAIRESEHEMVSDYQRMMGSFIDRVWVTYRG